MNPHLRQSAAQRFWRGVREPWALLGRMHAHPPLWRRYWQVVLVQVAVTLLVGGVVFWVGKRGADEWRDAFGSDTPLAEVPEATSTTPQSAVTTTTGSTGTTDRQEKRSAPAKHAATRARHPESTTPEAAAAAAAKAALAKHADGDEEEDADDEEADEAGASSEKASDDSEEAVAKEINSAAEAISKAPPGERAKMATKLAALAVARAKEAAKKRNRSSSQKAEPKDPEQERREQIAEQTEDLNDTIEALALGSHGLATDPPSDYKKAHRTRLKLEEQIGDVESAVQKLQALGGPGLTEAQIAQLRVARADLLTARTHERNLSGRLGALLGFLAVIYASLSIAQAGVLAMSRDFHDALSRELSLLVQVAPEDPPLRPRIRLDVPWVRRKTNRRVQFFLGFLPGTAVIWLIGRLMPLWLREVLVPGLTTLWAAYWWMVMTAGQSARAWTPPETTSPPWYIRGWKAMTRKVFLLRWLSVWGRIWERFSRRFNGPAERVEEQPMEFAGLALSRALALFPLTKLLVRPLFPVAAARLLVEHAATAKLPIPVTADELALAAQRAPDPEAQAHSGTWRPVVGDGLASRGQR